MPTTAPTIDRVDAEEDLRETHPGHSPLREPVRIDLSPQSAPGAEGPSGNGTGVSPRRLAAWWAVVLGGILVLAPAPDPEATIPAWLDLLGVGFWLTFAFALVGLVAGRPQGFRLSLAAAGLGLVLAVGCLATEHHAGVFPFVETAAFGSLAWLSARGLSGGTRPSATAG